ncbi:hypothetical protein D3C71_1735110 [compost metagenome]
MQVGQQALPRLLAHREVRLDMLGVLDQAENEATLGARELAELGLRAERHVTVGKGRRQTQYICCRREGNLAGSRGRLGDMFRDQRNAVLLEGKTVHVDIERRL